MRLLQVCALFAILLTSPLLGLAAVDPLFLGEWINVDANTRGVPRFRVFLRDGEARVEMWGRCHPVDCPWGESKVHESQVNPKLIAFQWKKGFAVDTQRAFLNSNGTLTLSQHTIYADGSGRPEQRTEDVFALAGSQALSEFRRQTQVPSARSTDDPGSQRQSSDTDRQVLAKAVPTRRLRNLNSCVRFDYVPARPSQTRMLATYRWLAIEPNGWAVGAINDVELDPAPNYELQNGYHVLQWTNNCTEPVALQAWVCIKNHYELARAPRDLHPILRTSYEEGAWLPFGITNWNIFITLTSDSRIVAIKPNAHDRRFTNAMKPGERQGIIEQTLFEGRKSMQFGPVYWIALDVPSAMKVGNAMVRGQISTDQLMRMGQSFAGITYEQSRAYSFCPSSNPANHFIEIFDR